MAHATRSARPSAAASATPALQVFADAAAAKAAQTAKGKPTMCKVLELKEACRLPRLDGGLLLVAGPSISDVSLAFPPFGCRSVG